MNEVDVSKITYYDANGAVINPNAKTDGSFWKDLGTTVGSLLGAFVGSKNQPTVQQQTPYTPQIVNLGQNNNSMMMIAIVGIVGVMFMMFMFMGKK